jgi:hypothetical protein
LTSLSGTDELPRHVRDFPFPLSRDAYRYQANLEPAPGRHETEAGSWGGTVMNAGPDYAEFIAERDRVLARNPGMIVTPAHMRAAEWDTLRYVMGRLAAEYPDDFGLACDGPRMRWVNHRLGVSLELTSGDDGSLPCGPLEYIGRQVVEDLVVLDRREGHLWADSGLVTFASGWSFPFIAGMSFPEIHGPVPRGNLDGVFSRAEAFLLRLQPGECYRRVNWALQSGRVLDRSVDSYAQWLPDAARFAAALGTAAEPDLGEAVSLRVEVQHLIGLETTDAVLFLIDTRFLSLADVARVPAWASRLAAVLAELPQDIADYKGITGLRPHVIAWLRQRLPASA